eukprot:gene14557-16059_t
MAEDLKPKKLVLPKESYSKIEALATTIELEGERIIILCNYRPPKATGKNHYMTTEQELNEIVSWATLQSHIVIITGDLNINRLQPQSSEGKMLIDVEDVHNLNCLITEPTRCTDSSQTLINVILTNKPEYFEMSGQLDMGMSDSNIVYGLMNKKIKQCPRKVISFRSRKHLDEERLKKDLEKVPWHVGSIFDSIDDQYYFCNKMVTEIINQHLPIKKMRVREKDVPYMTSESIRQKRKFVKIYARERTAENWELKKKHRNETTRQRNNAKKDYWMQKTEELKDKPRNIFTAFNPFIGKKNEKGENNLINFT